jgi:hypothetical protein
MMITSSLASIIGIAKCQATPYNASFLLLSLRLGHSLQAQLLFPELDLLLFSQSAFDHRLVVAFHSGLSTIFLLKYMRKCPCHPLPPRSFPPE